MKTCGRCNKIKTFNEFNADKHAKSGYRSQCKECMTNERLMLASHYKEWRNDPKRKEWYRKYKAERYEKDKDKIYARNKSRILKRMPCETCANIKAEAHHDDYAYPLDVRWLCSKCHRQWHKDHGEAKNSKTRPAPAGDCRDLIVGQ